MARGYEVVADVLVAAGVRDLFGVMGEGNLELITDLQSRCRVRYHAARHENGALGAAHGYAQAGDRLGVATVTHGPGLTNALTALVSAARLAAPVLLIVGDVAQASDGHVQAIEHEALVIAAGAPLERARSAATLAAVTWRAVRQAQAERRTVVLLVPVDILELPCPAAGTSPPEAAPRAVPGAADPDAVEAAAAALRTASRPLVLAGRGAAHARADLEALADRSGAMLATTLLGKGLFQGHPRDLGVCGGYATPGAGKVLAGIDAVLAFGASLNGFTTRAGTLFPDARIVHCDADGAVIGRTTAADVALVGDAATVARQLHAQLPETAADHPARLQALADAAAEARTDPQAPGDGVEGGGAGTGTRPVRALDPAALCQALDGVLPAERTLVVDGGHFTGYPCAWLQVPDPTGFVFTLGFGSVGLGLAAATGAAVARPDRTCVCVVGDGGMLMSLPELETLARLRLPVVVVVMDDGAYGAEVHHLRERGRPLDAAQFETPDLVRVAESLGASGVRVDRLEDLDEVGRRLAQGLDRPLVVHARIDGEVVSDWFAGLVTGASRFVGVEA